MTVSTCPRRRLGHESEVAGHFAARKSVDYIKRTYWWPTLLVDVSNFVRGCLVCHRNKTLNSRPQGLLNPLPIPSERWSSITMDFITNLPLSGRRKDAILVFVDRFSKMVHFVAVEKNMSAKDLSRYFMETVFRPHGLPREIICDRDPKFRSNFTQTLFASMDVVFKMSTSFHPQTDRQTNRKD